MYFNWLVSVTISLVGEENLKLSRTWENNLLWKILFCIQKRIFSALNACYLFIYVTISVYMCCVSFGILTDSVIILFPMTSLHMNWRKAYAKFHHSHLYIIKLIYISVYRIGFTDWYIYLSIYSLKHIMTPSWKNYFVLFIWREMISSWILSFCCCLNLHLVLARYYNALHLLCRGKRRHQRKNILFIFI